MGKSEDELFDEYIKSQVGLYKDDAVYIAKRAFLAGRASLAAELAKLREQRGDILLAFKIYRDEIQNFIGLEVWKDEDQKNIEAIEKAASESIAAIESESSPDAGKGEETK